MDSRLEELNFTQYTFPCFNPQITNVSYNNCQKNLTWTTKGNSQKSVLKEISEIMFVYVTPIIFLVGLAGNSLSLAVFLKKPLKRLSASTYLAALSFADICTLVFYVLVEWLRRGLKLQDPDADIKILDQNGLCQILLYFSYISRIMSCWIIVVFTIDRFVAVCYPLKRFKRSVKKGLALMLIIASISVIYKPILTRENYLRGVTVCTSTEGYESISFLLDTLYSVCITLVPFLIITILNIMLIRTLYVRNKEHSELFSEDSHTKIRLELTLIFIAISCCFILFNLPFTVAWIMFRVTETYDDTQTAWLYITRTFFYMNYCVNFFLYSCTGKCFRKTLRKMVMCKSRMRASNGLYLHCRPRGSLTPLGSTTVINTQVTTTNVRTLTVKSKTYSASSKSFL